MIGALAGGFALCVILGAVTAVPESIVGAAAIVAGHGGLLVTALAWATTGRGERGMALAPPLLLLAGAALAATVHDAGALAYLAVPLWLSRAAAQGRLVHLGLGTPISRAALGVGAMVGLALGAHLLVAASMTLGYRPRPATGAGLATILYDIGAQVLATECFFRGALFNRAQRRWSFGPAATLSALGSLVRYLVDPRLPGAAEIVTGMGFYMTLLSVSNCWLYWRFGSLLPGLVSALVFFAAYRSIAE